MDEDGDRSTSEVRSVDLKGPVVSLRPNPTADVVEVLIDPSDRFSQYQLFDMYGRLLMDREVEQKSDRVEIDLRALT